MLLRISRISCFLLLWTLTTFPHAFAADDAVWSALKSGRYIVLLRHAVTESGVGDPPGFTLGDCSTQRNLSAQGRSDARRIGEAFLRRTILVSEVLSSRWCRCIDTARLAFGRATPAPMLDSMFNDSEKAAETKIREVHAMLMHRPATGNLVLVTHNRNIQALTGISPSSGEMVVAEPGPNQTLTVIGRLSIPDT